MFALQLYYGIVIRTFCNKKLLYKKLVLNFMANHSRNTIVIIVYCSHNNRKQKKNYEAFSTEA